MKREELEVLVEAMQAERARGARSRHATLDCTLALQDNAERLLAIWKAAEHLDAIRDEKFGTTYFVDAMDALRAALKEPK